MDVFHHFYIKKSWFVKAAQKNTSSRFAGDIFYCAARIIWSGAKIRGRFPLASRNINRPFFLFFFDSLVFLAEKSKAFHGLAGLTCVFSFPDEALVRFIIDSLVEFGEKLAVHLALLSVRLL